MHKELRNFADAKLRLVKYGGLADPGKVAEIVMHKQVYLSTQVRHFIR
jgi:hypothetical protein